MEKFPVPGKKIPERENFGEIVHSPSLQNYAAIVCKSVDGAQCRASPSGVFTATFIHNTGPGRRLLIDLTTR